MRVDQIVWKYSDKYWEKAQVYGINLLRTRHPACHDRGVRYPVDTILLVNSGHQEVDELTLQALIYDALARAKKSPRKRRQRALT